MAAVATTIAAKELGEWAWKEWTTPRSQKMHHHLDDLIVKYNKAYAAFQSSPDNITANELTSRKEELRKGAASWEGSFKKGTFDFFYISGIRDKLTNLHAVKHVEWPNEFNEVGERYVKQIAGQVDDHFNKAIAAIQQEDILSFKSHIAKAKGLIDENQLPLTEDPIKYYTELQNAWTNPAEAKPESLLQLGQIYESAQNRSRAEQWYLQVLKNDPTNSDGFQKLVCLYSDQNEWDKIKQICLLYPQENQKDKLLLAALSAQEEAKKKENLRNEQALRYGEIRRQAFYADVATFGLRQGIHFVGWWNRGEVSRPVQSGLLMGSLLLDVSSLYLQMQEARKLAELTELFNNQMSQSGIHYFSGVSLLLRSAQTTHRLFELNGVKFTNPYYQKTIQGVEKVNSYLSPISLGVTGIQGVRMLYSAKTVAETAVAGLSVASVALAVAEPLTRYAFLGDQEEPEWMITNLALDVGGLFNLTVIPAAQIAVSHPEMVKETVDSVKDLASTADPYVLGVAAVAGAAMLSYGAWHGVKKVYHYELTKRIHHLQHNGLVAVNKGDYERAQDKYRQAFEANPADINNQLLMVLFGQRDLMEKIASSEGSKNILWRKLIKQTEVIEQKPELAVSELLISRGQAFVAVGNPGKAATLFGQALDSATTLQELDQTYSRIHNIQNKKKSAAQSFKRIVRRMVPIFSSLSLDDSTSLSLRASISLFRPEQNSFTPQQIRAQEMGQRLESIREFYHKSLAC